MNIIRAEKAKVTLLRFWTEAFPQICEATHEFRSRQPNGSNSIGARTEVAGLRWRYEIRRTNASVVLYADLKGDSQDAAKNWFGDLYQQKAEIENAFGVPLQWTNLDHHKGWHVDHVIEAGGYSAPEVEWPHIQQEMITQMLRLQSALGSYLSQLK